MTSEGVNTCRHLPPDWRRCEHTHSKCIMTSDVIQKTLTNDKPSWHTGSTVLSEHVEKSISLTQEQMLLIRLKPAIYNTFVQLRDFIDASLVTASVLPTRWASSFKNNKKSNHWEEFIKVQQLGTKVKMADFLLGSGHVTWRLFWYTCYRISYISLLFHIKVLNMWLNSAINNKNYSHRSVLGSEIFWKPNDAL